MSSHKRKDGKNWDKVMNEKFEKLMKKKLKLNK